jgi:hypothetical protein
VPARILSTWRRASTATFRAIGIEARDERVHHEYLSSGTAASKVSASANPFFSALKLLARFLSNGMGLISDGFDSAIDVLSYAGVYLGTENVKSPHRSLIRGCPGFLLRVRV